MIANYLAHRPLTHSVPFANGELWLNSGIYWFMGSLFLFVLTTPLIKIVFHVKSSCIVWGVGLYWLLVILAKFLLGDAWPENLFTWTFSLEGFAYFCFGILLRHRDEVNFPQLNRYVSFGCLIALLLGFCFLPDPCRLFVRSLAIPFMIVCLWNLTQKIHFPDWLTAAAFPVYLMHPSIGIPVIIIGKRLPVDLFVMMLFTWLATFAGCVIAGYLLRRFFPRTASFLFGGR